MAGLALASSTAHADRTMVVVVDSTGSMQAIRSSDSQQRFEAARALAAKRVHDAAVVEPAGLAPTGVAVFTFADTGLIAWDANGPAAAPTWVSAQDAQTIINTKIQVTSLLTPLADSICAAAKIASESGSVATTTVAFWKSGRMVARTTRPARIALVPTRIPRHSHGRTARGRSGRTTS